MRYAGQRGMVEPRLATGSLGVGRRARDTEYGECVRPLLHDEAGGHRDRFGAKPADCGGARRDADAGESPRNPWVRGAVAFAALGPPSPFSVTAHSKGVTGVFYVTAHSKGVSTHARTDARGDSERAAGTRTKGFSRLAAVSACLPKRYYTQSWKRVKGKAVPISFFW